MSMPYSFYKFRKATDLPKVPHLKNLGLNWISRGVSPKLGEGPGPSLKMDTV